MHPNACYFKQTKLEARSNSPVLYKIKRIPWIILGISAVFLNVRWDKEKPKRTLGHFSKEGIPCDIHTIDAVCPWGEFVEAMLHVKWEQRNIYVTSKWKKQFYLIEIHFIEGGNAGTAFFILWIRENWIICETGHSFAVREFDSHSISYVSVTWGYARMGRNTPKNLFLYFFFKSA